MKYLHMADLHIGKRLGEFDLLEDQKYMLEQVIALAKREQVDGILLAGDIYDKAVPSEGAVKLFDYFLRMLVKEKMDAFIISGIMILTRGCSLAAACSRRVRYFYLPNMKESSTDGK